MGTNLILNDSMKITSILGAGENVGAASETTPIQFIATRIFWPNAHNFPDYGQPAGNCRDFVINSAAECQANGPALAALLAASSGLLKSEDWAG